MKSAPTFSLLLICLLFSSLAYPYNTTFFNTVSKYHAYNIGTFEIEADQNGYLLFVKLDRAELLADLSDGCDTRSQLKYCLELYFKDHFILLFNEQATNLTIDTYQLEELFINVTLRIDQPLIPIKTIEVTNTCLIGQVEDQINILHIDLQGQYRSFKLDKNRMSTLITYP